MAEGMAESMVAALSSRDTSRDVFEERFRRHWPRVHAILERLTADREEAEDLAIEVFVKLHRRPPRGDDAADVSGWLYRVAMHAGLNALRARSRRRRHEEDAARELSRLVDAEGAPPGIAPAAFEIERGEERERVRRVLATMPERSASILLLRHSGASYREIAGTVRISPGSVGTLLARAERDFERRYRALGE